MVLLLLVLLLLVFESLSIHKDVSITDQRNEQIVFLSPVTFLIAFCKTIPVQMFAGIPASTRWASFIRNHLSHFCCTQ